LSNDEGTPSVEDKWHSLHVNEALASYTQEYLWRLDEQIQVPEQDSILRNVVLILTVTNNDTSLSIRRMKVALNNIIQKHSILRTRLKYNTAEDCLTQSIKPLRDEDQYYSFQISTIARQEELGNILRAEQMSRSYFNLEQGIVLRCHLIRYYLNNNVNDDLLLDGDTILFSFHRSAFDGDSASIFLHDFQLAYMNELSDNDDALKYIDYSIYEREILMTDKKDEAVAYWNSILDEYNIEKQLLLPFDHSNRDRRTGHSSSVHFELDDDLVQKMILCKGQMNVSIFQLALSVYYVYLFKLTNSQYNDICVGSVIANRYRPDLKSLIGMFVSVLPFCLKFDPTLSFSNILKHVQQLSVKISKYSYLPNKQISSLLRPHASILPFPQT
ncbi:unnamed protein product, partial [Didymodactylos carnosus]